MAKKKTKIEPLGNNILLKPELTKGEEKTESGIIIPETVDKEKPQTAEVVAVGPGKMDEDGERMSMSVKVGDKVIYSKYSPSEIKIDEEEYYIISEDDVLAILK